MPNYEKLSEALQHSYDVVNHKNLKMKDQIEDLERQLTAALISLNTIASLSGDTEAAGMCKFTLSKTSFDWQAKLKSFGLLKC